MLGFLLLFGILLIHLTVPPQVELLDLILPKYAGQLDAPQVSELLYTERPLSYIQTKFVQPNVSSPIMMHG